MSKVQTPPKCPALGTKKNRAVERFLIGLRTLNEIRTFFSENPNAEF